MIIYKGKLKFLKIKIDYGFCLIFAHDPEKAVDYTLFSKMMKIRIKSSTLRQLLKNLTKFFSKNRPKSKNKNFGWRIQIVSRKLKMQNKEFVKQKQLRNYLICNTVLHGTYLTMNFILSLKSGLR